MQCSPNHLSHHVEDSIEGTEQQYEGIWKLVFLPARQLCEAARGVVHCRRGVCTVHCALCSALWKKGKWLWNQYRERISAVGKNMGQFVTICIQHNTKNIKQTECTCPAIKLLSFIAKTIDLTTSTNAKTVLLQQFQLYCNIYKIT